VASPSLKQINKDRSQFIDATTTVYRERLDRIVSRTQATVSAQLANRLQVGVDGNILPNQSNREVIRSIDRLFSKEMERRGFDDLNRWFSNQFPKQLPYFQDTLDAISETLVNPLPEVELRPSDARALAHLQITATDQLDAVAEIAGAAARKKALLQIGGSGLSDLTDAIVETFEATIPEARTLAETSMSTYFRTITDRGFQFIENKTGKTALYEYQGPDDKRTREFCQNLLESKKQYTRAEIDAMSNGQLPNTFRTGGGFNCRHAFVMVGFK
jgi:hypothetical protein